ncbi:MAG: hypothetical protein LBF78_11070 [Treponema sp.]|jgi:hypothetical protein|nr:hypothetical protein [Treponema sp.]
MKKILLCALVFTLAAGAAVAAPLGLRVYTDGVSFGNVAAEGYKFAGDGGLARIPLGLEFSKALGPVRFSTALEYALSFTATPANTGDPKHQPQWNLSGSYGLQLAEASKLSFSLYNKLHFDASKGGEFADNIWDDIGPGVRFDQTFGFGSLYAVTELSVRIYTYENADGSDKGLGLETGENSGFQAGVNTNFGLYGYVRPYLVFLSNGESPDDMLTKFDIRVGYRTGPIDARATFTIPAVDFDATGLTIQPRFTYNFLPTLSAYADLKIGAIGKKDADVAITPQIGVSFSF